MNSTENTNNNDNTATEGRKKSVDAFTKDSGTSASNAMNSNGTSGGTLVIVKVRW